PPRTARRLAVRKRSLFVETQRLQPRREAEAVETRARLTGRTRSHVVDQDRTDLPTFGLDRECPHNGLGGADRAHLGEQAPQNAAIGAEGDEIELHAIERDVGFILNDEVQTTAVIGTLYAVEFDHQLLVRRRGAE